MRRVGTVLVAAVLGLSVLAPLAAADAATDPATAHAPGVATTAPADPTPTLDADPVELPRPVRGRTALRLLGDQVDEAAELNGLATAELREVLRTDDTAWLTTGGLLHFQEPVVAARAPTPARAASYPLGETFALHSKPGSPHTIFIDVDGATVGGTLWHEQHPTTPTAHPAWDPLGDGPAFSDQELAAVQEVWARVAEDYAPFDVDVTTEDPGPDAILRSSVDDPVFGAHALVTPSAAYATLCDSACGGIAFIDVFDEAYGAGGDGYGYVQPAWVFPQGTGNSPKDVAEALAHEVGHQLGLTHDGNATEGYDVGHGSWAPIMGLGYYRPISQWSQGDYPSANNQQDDVAIIGGVLGLRLDEAPSTAAGAPEVPGGTSYVSGRTDVDTFRLGTCAGSVTVSAAPLLGAGADLDLGLTLLDGSGTVVASADPPAATIDPRTASGLDATITTTVPDGEYFLAVDGVGHGTWSDGYDDYGSLGAYSVDLAAGCDGGVAPGAPKAPVGLSTTGSTPTTVTLAWSPPGEPGTSDVEGYRLTRSGSEQVVELGAAATTYTWTGLTAGTSYLFSVSAVNASGSGVGAAVSATTASARPSAPLAVTAGWSRPHEGILLRWSAPASDGGLPLTGYDVHIGSALAGTVPASVSAVSVTELPPGTYTLGVAAVNASGSGPVAEATAVVPAAPANDAFAGRATLSGASGTVPGDNRAATGEAGDPAPPSEFEGVGGASVWYSWTATTTGPATFSTSSDVPGRDTTLAAYTGSTLAGLVRVAGNDDVSGSDLLSRITFDAIAGTTYAVAVDGYPATVAGTGPFTLAWAGRPTTVTSLSTAVSGRTVTLTAHVSSPAGTPAGTVTFRDGSTALATEPLSDGAASYDVTGVRAGSHSYTATFVPTDPAAYTGSSGGAGLSLPAAPTSTSLGVALAGRTVTLTAETTSDVGHPVGQVWFWDDDDRIGVVDLSSGTASLVVTKVLTGEHAYLAEFHPSVVGDFASSTTPQHPLTVGPSPTTTTITDVHVETNQVVWEIEVTSPDGTPEGTVDLFAGPISGTPLRSVTLVEGRTTVGVVLDPGTYDLAAVFHPLDTTWAGSESATVTRTVDPPPPDPTPTTTSLDVTFSGRTATLSSVVGSSAGTPEGAVQFYDGETALALVPLVAGAATLTRVVPAGSRYFRAEFFPARPEVHGTSVSETVTRTVLPTPTSTTLSVSTSGTRVTLASVVSVEGEAASGVVRFAEAGVVVGTAAVVSGRAALRLDGVTPGTHSYRATFVPDGTDQTRSTSAARTVQVLAPPLASRTTLTAPRSARAGARPTVTVRVLRGTAAASGAVVLRYGAKRTTLVLRAGRASFRLPKVRAGTLRLTATYAGNATTRASTATATIRVTRKR